MKKYIIIFVISFIPMTIYSQINLSDVRVTGGIIQTVFDDQEWYDDYRWAFYPEIQIGGDFLKDPFIWGIYFGYWGDGIDTPITGVEDLITYSYQAQIVGIRFGISREDIMRNNLIQMRFATGISQHMLQAEYIGGTGPEGNPGNDSSEGFMAMEADLGVGIKLFHPFRLYVGFHSMIQLEKLDLGYREVRNSFKGGILVDF